MIDLMPTRERQLAATLDALQETGVPLVQRAAGYRQNQVGQEALPLIGLRKWTT